MWSAISDFSGTLLAVVLCAAAVKITDDYLDSDNDRQAGAGRNLADVIGPGAPVYALLILAFSAGLAARITLPLFLASYIVGMFNDLQRVYPTRLSGMQEGTLVFLLGSLLFGLHAMVFSLAFIMAVQLADDCIDIHRDRQAGLRNLACRFGMAECALAAAGLLLAAFWMDVTAFLPVFAGTILLYGVALWREEVAQWRKWR